MVVVAMVIILTVSLSVATRSVVNVRTSSEEASSSAAFSAAEAGIEKYLKNSTNFTGNIGTANVVVTNNAVGGPGVTQLVLNNGNPVLQDDGVDLWLSTYSSASPYYLAPFWTGTIRVYWETNANCSSNPAPAAIEVLLISGPSGGSGPLSAPVMSRFAIDQCIITRRGSNHFSQPTLTGPWSINNVSFVNAFDIPIPGGNSGIIARIIPLYLNTVVGVSGATNFPAQGAIVSSTGASGDTKRKITIYQGYPKVPAEFFQYTLFAPCPSSGC